MELIMVIIYFQMMKVPVLKAAYNRPCNAMPNGTALNIITTIIIRIGVCPPNTAALTPIPLYEAQL